MVMPRRLMALPDTGGRGCHKQDGLCGVVALFATTENVWRPSFTLCRPVTSLPASAKYRQAFDGMSRGEDLGLRAQSQRFSEPHRHHP